ncbi:MAG: hypothetical protein DDT19_01260 [Syntrophomonadaceae bacterium]|nr:hypothetical protein [Bacillota bacterium]
MEKTVKVTATGTSVLVESSEAVGSPVEAIVILNLGIQAIQAELMKQPKLILPAMKVPSKNN